MIFSVLLDFIQSIFVLLFDFLPSIVFKLPAVSEVAMLTQNLTNWAHIGATIGLFLGFNLSFVIYKGVMKIVELVRG